MQPALLVRTTVSLMPRCLNLALNVAWSSALPEALQEPRGFSGGR